MPAPDETQKQTNLADVSRRRVLQAAGTTVLAGSTLGAGVASAHTVEKAVFCGCGRVCVSGSGDVTVIVAQPGQGGEFEQETFTRRCDFCVSNDEDLSRGGQIVAIEVDGTIICNPNNCAERALDALDITCDRVGEQGGPCNAPP